MLGGKKDEIPTNQRSIKSISCDLSQMSVVVHQTHWYMRGPGFLTLHPMMDEFMDDLNAQLDEVSELDHIRRFTLFYIA